MNLSTRDLRAITALIDERNFTRAAELCHLSQSAFSTLIANIEHDLGTRLFDRTTRNVELTPEGRLFEPSARRVLADLDSVVSNFREYATKTKGRVSIAALPSMAAGWLPGVLTEFRAHHPGIDFELFDLLSDQCLALVRAGRCDLAIASAGPHEKDLQTEELCADRFYLVCERDHPLARLSRIRLRDLAGHPFIHLARTSSVRQHLEAALHPTAVRTAFEVEQLATVTALVEAGFGITVVPALTLFHFRRPGLVVRPIASPQITRRIYLVSMKGRSLSIAAQALHDLMRMRKPKQPKHAETA
jgi:LysR family transcriptional regulator, carnitine catabolism transcriptional activator